MFFLKLGGSLITDKTRENAPRLDVITRLAREIQQFKTQVPQLKMLLGHGSGSFGHAAARRYGTRSGVHDADAWRGFAEVSVAAARLNRIVADALHEAGLPVIGVAPSASAQCEDGRLAHLAVEPIRQALDHGLIPLVMGDVAFDGVRGGTIVSTEEVFAYLADHLPVSHVLLAGETEGVYHAFVGTGRGGTRHGGTRHGGTRHGGTRHGPSLHVIPLITPLNWDLIRDGVGGSGGADVTGGMAGKVQDMLALVLRHPTVTVRIFSGLVEGEVARALRGERVGTEIAATDDARLVGPNGPTNV
jgi:isopentenyl phosphate kinase